MSEQLKLLLELLLCFFACIGMVCLAQDFISWILKKKKKTYAIVTIDLSKSLNPTREILDFAVFYHNSYAQRFIEKVVIIGVSDALKEIESELKEVLKIPLEFAERK